MADHAAHRHSGHPPSDVGTHKDPVCGMQVVANEHRRVTHDGERYYFCSDHCVHKFRGVPERYLNAGAKAPEAIVASAKDRGIDLKRVEDFDSDTGKGVRGRIGEKRVLIGNQRALEDAGIEISGDAGNAAAALREKGQTVIHVAVNDVLAGLIGITDPIKTTTAEAIRYLHKCGVRVVMATGDHEGTAKTVAAELGIDEFHAGVLPQDKSKLVEQLQSQGRIVAIVEPHDRQRGHEHQLGVRHRQRAETQAGRAMSESAMSNSITRITVPGV